MLSKLSRCLAISTPDYSNFSMLSTQKAGANRAIANLKFSATFIYLMEELGKIQTPSR